MAFGWFGRKKENSDAAAASETEKDPHEPPPPPPAPSLFQRLKQGLSKTRKLLNTDIEDLFITRKKIDESSLERIEELLITADIGVQTTMTLMDRISKEAKKIESADALKEILKHEIQAILKTEETRIPAQPAKPHVIMVVGVNGVGKTTTIGKIAAKEREQGKSVVIAAADTFRAAAIEQLEIWSKRSGAEIVKHKEKSDPAAVAYDGLEAAISRGADILIIDTAGRLHTKVNLMEELKKIKRTLSKKIPDSPHEVLLILDATTGQNAVSQAQLFNEAVGVTGIALTKLDGTAKGGIVVNICATLHIPIKYIGIGEKLNDLQEFDPVLFSDALF
ncbi:MAG: signal recognition particle-docking protein FtsY [Thermodesulfobacteriota bacterium]